MTFFKIFKHLLPNARAWKLTTNKQLREFFEGLSSIGSDVKEFYDLIFSDINPQTTRELLTYETQFGLQNTAALTEQQRRDRLATAWSSTGDQDPKYIQDTLQANGFDVYVHEWWVPGTEPAVNVKACVTPINPNLWLRQSQIDILYLVTCGNPVVTCGNPASTAGSILQPVGYPLVNKVVVTVPEYFATCGNPAATCGNPAATCGNYSSLKEIQKDYRLPLDNQKFQYFLYIGGATFGDTATVDLLRQEEFETLCLKISPLQAWLGMLIKYV